MNKNGALNPQFAIAFRFALLFLGELLSLHYVVTINKNKEALLPCFYLWWAIRGSNPGPTGYEPVALTN